MKNTEKNLDDIIFENRNKDYGAYTLRKNYKKNLMSAVIIAVIIFLLGVSVPLIANYFKKPVVVISDGMGPTTLITPPKNKIITPPQKTIEEKKKDYSFKPPVVSAMDVDDPELSDLIDKSDNINTVEPQTDIDVPDENPKSPVIEPEEAVENPIAVVEEMPEFPGGESARLKFMYENTKYPVQAREIGISGTVYLSFVVEKDGSISNIKILRGIGGGCDEEAIRMVNVMPKWKPGRQNGKEVRVLFNLPIVFRLV